MKASCVAIAPVANDQRSRHNVPQHGIYLVSNCRFNNETRFRVQGVKCGVNCNVVSYLMFNLK